MNKRPIGVLDSGVGGLTVWKEITRLLPLESTVYLGDSLNAPYGDKSSDEIYQLARLLIHFLLAQNVKLIVIACNTITTVCLDRLRNEFKDIPLIGTVPVVKKAVEISKKKKIGILSTNNTANSYYQKHLLDQFASGVTVVNRGTNKIVPLVEKGEIDGATIEKVLRQVLLPFQESRVDTLALGCTHFPFLAKQMKKILGPDVTLLDSGEAIARQVERVLEHNQALGKREKVVHTLFTTGNTKVFEEIVGKIADGKKHTGVSSVVLQ